MDKSHSNEVCSRTIYHKSNQVEYVYIHTLLCTHTHTSEPLQVSEVLGFAVDAALAGKHSKYLDGVWHKIRL